MTLVTAIAPARRLLPLLLTTLALLAGCDKGDSVVNVPPASTTSALVVLNTLGRTLSVIDLATDSVYRNVVAVGSAPNQVVASGGRLYVVNSLSNSIQVFSASTYALLGTVNVGTGSNPMNVALLGTAKGYVTCLQSDSVKVFDPASFAIVKGIRAGVGPTGILIASGKVYVTNTGFNVRDFSYGPGSVTVIDAGPDTVAATIPVEKNPQALALAPDGKLHLACTGDYVTSRGKVVVIDPRTASAVRTLEVGGNPTAIAIAPDYTAYVGFSFPAGVLTYNAATYAPGDSSANPLLHRGGASILCDGSSRIFVADFENDQVVLENGRAITRVYGVGDGPQSLALK